MRPRRAGLVASVALLSLGFPACLAPPALFPSHGVHAVDLLALFPPGSERVEIEIEPGVSLRGVFVPSDPGAPVVLHLLESGASVSSVEFPYSGVAAQLADLGFASLIVDYRGVGESDGERSVDHLRPDAITMWNEALRRAGGRDNGPPRVVVRGTSIGSVAAAELLDAGERPAGIVLVAPVLPDTVTERVADFAYGNVTSFLARILYRPVTRTDAPAAFAHASGPLLVRTSLEDEFLGDDGRERLKDAVARANGRWLLVAGDHLQTAMTSRWISDEEMELLREVAPDVPPREARARELLDRLAPAIAKRIPEGSRERGRLVELAALVRTRDPELVAAAALANESASDSRRLLWHYERKDFAGLTFEDEVEVLALEDPAGRLDLDAIERVDSVLGFRGTGRRHFHVEVGGAGCARIARAFGRDAQPDELEFTAVVDKHFHVHYRSDLAGEFAKLRERGVSVLDARRQIARILLKAWRIPDRLRAQDDGRVVVEAFEDGAWTALDLGSTEAAEPEKAGHASPK